MTLALQLGTNLKTGSSNIRTAERVLPGVRNDEQLVDACLRGDQTAWNELVDRYGRLVYYIAHRYNLEPAEIDDVFQTVFEIALVQLGKLKNKNALASWLATITAREAQRVRKAKMRFVELSDMMPDTSEPPLETVHREFLAQELKRAMQQLDPFAREFILALMSEPTPSYKELALRFSMAEGSIGPTRERCLKKLQAILKRMGVELT
jgi:RNA polymerase sigma factor (sigma-70 family)